MTPEERLHALATFVQQQWLVRIVDAVCRDFFVVREGVVELDTSSSPWTSMPHEWRIWALQHGQTTVQRDVLLRDLAAGVVDKGASRQKSFASVRFAERRAQMRQPR